MPAVDRATGKVLLAEKGRLALSPDGHGGTLAALAAVGPGGGPSCLEEMRDRGVRTLFYFQVDNPLVAIADPGFLGLHRQAEAEVSFKVVEKVAPDEKVGVVVQVDGVPRVIEYSDLPAALAERRAPDGGLELSAGSIAIHAFDREFVERIATGGAHLPYHRAIKKVKHLDAAGAMVDPSDANAVKFETFIFDALPLASRWAMVECDRAVEFEPLKNATGPDSPATVRQRMSDIFAGWLEAAGVTVPRRSDGTVPVRDRDQPPLRRRRRRVEVQAPGGVGRRRAALPGLDFGEKFDDRPGPAGIGPGDGDPGRFPGVIPGETSLERPHPLPGLLHLLATQGSAEGAPGVPPHLVVALRRDGRQRAARLRCRQGRRQRARLRGGQPQDEAEVPGRGLIGGEYQSLDIGEEFEHDYRDLDEVHRTFGAILCIDVIEHMPLEAGLTLLNRLAGLLDPGGTLVVQTPNALCSRNPMGWDMTHVQVYNVADLWAFLTVQGLDTRGYRMCFTDRRPGKFPKPARLLRIWMTRNLGSDDAENVLFVARKAKAPAASPAPV